MIESRGTIALVLTAASALALSACTGDAAPTDSPSDEPATEPPTTEPPGDDPVALWRDFEKFNALPRDAFYDAQPNGEAGTLIAVEAFDGWKLPDTLMHRIVYNSVDTDGDPVAASAAVLVPWGPVPDGGWPVVAWGHGTSGVDPSCAPSLLKDLYYPEIMLALLANGYAVVATDYSGLGAGDGHEYISMPANADDLRYAVPAAREAVPELSEQWVAMGHSQGGQAAWGAASRTSDDGAVDGLVGAVALAPATPLDLMTEQDLRAPGMGVYLPYVAASLELQFGVDREDVLSEAGLAAYDDVVASCLPVAMAIVGEEATIEAFADPDWLGVAAAETLAERNVYTDTTLKVPLLAVAGAEDMAVPAHTVQTVVDRQCETGGTVAFRTVDGDHDEMIGNALPDIIEWIGARFAGEEATGGC
ncbi:alpha/beta hydrolase family protein [Agromyces archimandritae]|uniref:Alpha/beta hydrolase n=1 Tax=Agromyces archimandritae TaxID=2781962 RepID=A0A975IPD5_9MICO|nr:alpha/beta hydrolase [Agromyces archimandritae]QTX05527.1 alpha/beta hydrolase [Agromyces archimandritae]